MTDTIRGALRRGDYLVAYDAAVRAATADPTDVGARYLAVLALARAGATDRAAEQLVEFGLDGPAPAGVAPALAEDLGALQARLAKDRALAVDGDERRRRATEAARAYEAIYVGLGRPFSGINAATMWMLAGNEARSRELATAVLGRPNDSAYWRAATDAEAYLLLGDRERAVAALHVAAATDAGVGERATTRKQLALVTSEASTLAALTVPTVIHYTGHMATRFDPTDEQRLAAEVAQWLDDNDVGFGFGALACGSDLIVAEALLARGAELHVVLPCIVEDFVRLSVRPGGADWEARFQRGLAAATSIGFATEGPYLGSPDLFAFGAAVAMGRARLRAAYLSTSVQQLALWDGTSVATPAGTAVDVETWQSFGGTTHVIPVRRVNGSDSSAADDEPSPRIVRALIFADAQGFSRISEPQVPVFVEHVLRPLGETVDRFRDAIRFRNTWGDGVYLVVDDVPTAARCALAMQETMRAIDAVALGLPPLALRVGAHAGPVFEEIDPITGRAGFFGVEVTRTARIEPGTPPGDVYVTDPFAALLALSGATDVSCQYVGPVPTAKGYGTFPLYTLRGRGSRIEV